MPKKGINVRLQIRKSLAMQATSKNSLILNKKVPFLFNTIIKLNKFGKFGGVFPTLPKMRNMRKTKQEQN